MQIKTKNLPISHEEVEAFFYSLNPDVTEKKVHTIRAGHRWKQGQKFSPRIWSGKPYRSHQIIFAPDVELKKVWEFEINKLEVFSDKYTLYQTGDDKIEIVKKIAENDGLNTQDFLDWFKFPQPFDGQILCWNEGIKY